MVASCLHINCTLYAPFCIQGCLLCIGCLLLCARSISFTHRSGSKFNIRSRLGVKQLPPWKTHPSSRLRFQA
jgi:hypothetical protein